MKTKFLAIAFVAMAPLAAFGADGASYSYVDANYQFSGSFDAGAFGSVDTDGFGVKASFGISDNFFVQFDYQTLGTSPDSGNVDSYNLYGGWHNDLFFARVGYASADYVGVSDSGFSGAFGVRAMLGEGFELNGYVGMADLGDDGTSTDLGVGGVWMFADNMGLSVNYDLRSLSDFGGSGGLDVDVDTFGVGFRFNFN